MRKQGIPANTEFCPEMAAAPFVVSTCKYLHVLYVDNQAMTCTCIYMYLYKQTCTCTCMSDDNMHVAAW